MTVEGQRYLEECRKVLKEEQMDADSMGLDFGLPVSDIQKVVKSNQEAPVMKAIIIGLMEGIGEIDFLCEGNYNQFQVREIVEGLKNGLDLEEVKTYAGNELPASRMRTMRIQLEESKAKKEVPKDEEMRSYMKNLMGIMEQSIQQFQESNDRFTALSSLVKEHVVEEKNQEIKDLYENLQYKDKNIQELKEKLAKKEQEIQDLKKEAEKYREKTEAASRETKVVLEEKSIQTAEGLQKSKRRLLGIAMLGKKVPKSVVEKILEYNLSAEQLEEIRQCVESGLADAEILQVMENSPSPERMKKMREIILLMRKRKAGVKMAELEHVVKTFSLLEAAEKEQPFLTREQKQDLYRIAFHKESMEEVEKIILQLQVPHAGKEEKERILSHYLEPFFQVPENILQIENYIFQLQYMTYEKEKANHMLEALLKQENIQYDLEAMLTEGKIKAAVPVKKDRAMG